MLLFSTLFFCVFCSMGPPRKTTSFLICSLFSSHFRTSSCRARMAISFSLASMARVRILSVKNLRVLFFREKTDADYYLMSWAWRQLQQLCVCVCLSFLRQLSLVFPPLQPAVSHHSFVFKNQILPLSMYYVLPIPA